MSLPAEQRLKGEERGGIWEIGGGMFWAASSQCKGPETPRSQKPSGFEGQHGVRVAAVEKTSWVGMGTSPLASCRPLKGLGEMVIWSDLDFSFL